MRSLINIAPEHFIQINILTLAQNNDDDMPLTPSKITLAE